MLNKFEKILAFMVDLETDDDINISLDYEYDSTDDMFYIFHDIKGNDFNKHDTLKINTKLVHYLDNNEIINYTFGFSEHLKKNATDNQEFLKKDNQSTFDNTNFVVITSSGHSQLDLVA